ncbi:MULTISPECIES: hypothetical protein [Cysteiniphilum]|uniref:hypothetical protein n=1 Tax=Cysteiniphilum TaxID=2056696 RepID=UPI0017866B4A|nr:MULTISPECIES: hypothetical protein [Cysteiniphilum]
MKNMYKVIQKLMWSAISFLLCISLSIAGDTPPTDVKGFGSWAGDVSTLFTQIKQFLVLICLVIGLWYLIMGLLQLRKSLTPQGAQQDILKQAFGHIVVGVVLISIVAFVQMFQKSVVQNAGSDSARQAAVFNIPDATNGNGGITPDNPNSN